MKSDVTRFRYGDEQHLEEALQRIFRYGKAGGIRKGLAPTLSGLREQVVEGKCVVAVCLSQTPNPKP